MRACPEDQLVASAMNECPPETKCVVSEPLGKESDLKARTVSMAIRQHGSKHDKDQESQSFQSTAIWGRGQEHVEAMC